MNIYAWDSKSDITNRAGGPIYDVLKYNPKIRKRALLRRRNQDGSDDQVVAWFVSEEEAIRFCDAILGGIRRVDG